MKNKLQILKKNIEMFSYYGDLVKSFHIFESIYDILNSIYEKKFQNPLREKNENKCDHIIKVTGFHLEVEDPMSNNLKNLIKKFGIHGITNRY